MAPMSEKEKCLGCGFCVHACPTESLGLIPSENPAKPPETTGDWVKSFFKDKKRGC